MRVGAGDAGVSWFSRFLVKWERWDSHTSSKCTPERPSVYLYNDLYHIFSKNWRHIHRHIHVQFIIPYIHFQLLVMWVCVTLVVFLECPWHPSLRHRAHIYHTCYPSYPYTQVSLHWCYYLAIINNTASFDPLLSISSSFHISSFSIFASCVCVVSFANQCPASTLQFLFFSLPRRTHTSSRSVSCLHDEFAAPSSSNH